MTSKASPSRSLSVLNRSLGAIGSPLKRSPSAHRPSSAARFSMTFISPSDRPGSRFCLAVKPIGTDGWLSTGASTLSSTAAASAKPPEKHCPITPTPLLPVFSLRSRASARR